MSKRERGEGGREREREKERYRDINTDRERDRERFGSRGIHTSRSGLFLTYRKLNSAFTAHSSRTSPQSISLVLLLKTYSVNTPQMLVALLMKRTTIVLFLLRTKRTSNLI